jgi:expansin (peptidoglycan-binding protein)
VGRHLFIAITVAAIVVGGSGLAVLGLVVLPETTIAVDPVSRPESIGAVQDVNAPGGIGADADTTATSTGTDSPGTTGSVSRPKDTAVLAERILPGTVHHGIATFYDTDGTGACMLDPSDDLMVAAMNSTDFENSRACGSYLDVTGPNGRSVTVQVTDLCPECPVGALDLSAEAFASLASPSVGRISISWELLSPNVSGPISLRYKSGSSPYWCAVQVINHRNPVATLEFLVNGSWTSVPRQDYNYFVSESGIGCGDEVRVTDIFDQTITVQGLTLTPGTIQEGPGQFSRH